MNLLELRKRFAQESGRYDLVNEDGTDNGADFYIHGGQRHLDYLTQFRKANAVNHQILRPGDYIFYLHDCRAVYDISYIAHTDYTLDSQPKTRTWQPLPEWTVHQAQDRFPHSFNHMPREKPIMYCLCDVRGTQDTGGDTDKTKFDSMSDLLGIVAGQYYDKIGVLLLPIPLHAIQVRVRGMFYTPRLRQDNDMNYWSVEEPTLLIQAALRELEVFHRNTQGVKDWDMAIMATTTLREQDFVFHEAYPVSQMRG